MVHSLTPKSVVDKNELNPKDIAEALRGRLVYNPCPDSVWDIHIGYLDTFSYPLMVLKLHSEKRKLLTGILGGLSSERKRIYYTSDKMHTVDRVTFVQYREDKGEIETDLRFDTRDNKSDLIVASKIISSKGHYAF